MIDFLVHERTRKMVDSTVGLGQCCQIEVVFDVAYYVQQELVWQVSKTGHGDGSRKFE